MRILTKEEQIKERIAAIDSLIKEAENNHKTALYKYNQKRDSLLPSLPKKVHQLKCEVDFTLRVVRSLNEYRYMVLRALSTELPSQKLDGVNPKKKNRRRHDRP